MPREADEIPLMPCYAATHDLNGMGELTGTHGLTEWGFINGVSRCIPIFPSVLLFLFILELYPNRAKKNSQSL